MPLFQVDAFTDAPFSGNPAGVYVTDAFPPDDWMQHLAAEMNLSETAFVVPRATATAPARYALRWFTPTDEVDLCGHATLAAAHILTSDQTGASAGSESGPLELTFETASGPLKATRTRSAPRTHSGAISLDFPADPPRPMEAPAGLLDALGVANPVFVGKGDRDVLIHVRDPQSVLSCTPDMDAVAGIDARGVIVTAAAGEQHDGADFISRCFFPAVGVPEDPVTGSAHCALGPYWAERLGRTKLVGRQVSPRGGVVGVTATAEGRVELTGHAVTVFRGGLSPLARPDA
ncbi:PhzF family phenazine biosynthesis protein [Longibacter sp.]|uniref:PhzF family phenazine biosynthesis protein n=1 Tax=Longibacter sp. TaxID=2045415 RepID=UPI003EC07D5E